MKILEKGNAGHIYSTVLQYVHFYITWFCAEIALQVAAKIAL
jgi:hypothetical protein